MTKKNAFPFLLLLPLSLSGFSCQQSASSSENSSPSSSASSSSSFSPSFPEQEIPEDGVYLQIKNQYLREGQDFFDAASPTPYRWKNGRGSKLAQDEYTLTIVNTDTSVEYGPYQGLSSGYYEATLAVGDYSNTAYFYVYESVIEDGSEGKGYHQAVGNYDDYRISNYSSLSILGDHSCPSIGSPGLLVVPVYFTDQSEPTSEQIEDIEKGFFGEANETGWQSLRSYYETSSYGKLHFQGVVMDPLQFPMSSSDISKSTNNLVRLLSYVAEQAYLQGIDLNSLDTDKDGFIDGVDIIYFHSMDGGFWWNYTSSQIPPRSSEGTNYPLPCRFFFSGYDMLKTGYYDIDIDAHCLIHETGHMLGLDDYYGTYSSPAGYTTMMDHNVGDLDAYSKSILGWVSPRIIEDTSSDFILHLSSFPKTGETILLRNTDEDTFVENPYDEYLLLEYYTPTELNESDSTGYPEWYSSYRYGHGGTYEAAGLKVYHIDSRAMSTYGRINGEEKTILGTSYVDEPYAKETVLEDGSFYGASSIPARNSYGFNASQNHLISLIAANGDNSHLTGKNAAGTSLFGSMDQLFTAEKESRFSFAKYSSFFSKKTTLNDGTHLNWSFEVINNDEEGCDIRFVLN